jgi:hypothetical protein
MDPTFPRDTPRLKSEDGNTVVARWRQMKNNPPTRYNEQIGAPSRKCQVAWAATEAAVPIGRIQSIQQ